MHPTTDVEDQIFLDLLMDAFGALAPERWVMKSYPASQSIGRSLRGQRYTSVIFDVIEEIKIPTLDGKNTFTWPVTK